MSSENCIEDYKIFNDPINGHLEIHPLCIQVMDTPEFQRLRYIKQNGLTSYVFPGACHTRFEHSIGVCHIAGQFAMMLKGKQPELGIDDEDILCIKLAGLCHDLGHGPFSHTWERFLNAKLQPKKWTHEQCSVKLFKYLIKNNHLEEKFAEYFGENYDAYIGYIEQQIDGDRESRQKHPWTSNKNGELKNKNFLYEIVANKSAGVDVDKWDYLSRDCYYLGFKPSFDHEYLMKFARVCKDRHGNLHICFRDKEWLNVEQMFHTRWMLHRVAYQHRVVKAMEIMLLEALSEADEHLKLKGANGKMKCLSETAEDIESFIKISDCIFQTILFSEDEKLKKARQILQNLEKRNLFEFVGRAFIDEELANEIKKDRLKYAEEIVENMVINKQCLTAEDIILETINFDYGMKTQNPLEHVYFYSKGEPNIAKKQKISDQSKMIIAQFEEKFLICLCRQKTFLKEAENGFVRWCKKNALKPFQEGGIISPSTSSK